MKRIIALVITVITLCSSVMGCSGSFFRFKDDTSVTRGEWIEMLSTTFGLDEYQKKAPYYKDVTSENTKFNYIQSCCEWGILNSDEKKFKENNPATLEFVISTAVLATGIEFEEDEEKTECALKYATEQKYVPSDWDYDSWATTEQCQEILSTVKFAYLSQEVEPKSEFDINDEVKDLREGTSLQNISGEIYRIEGFVPVVDEVYITPGTEENPEGIAIKVTSVVDNGDGSYQIETTTPELYEVFDEIDYAGVAIPQYEDIQPSEGVQIVETTDVEDVSSLENPEYQIVPLKTEKLSGVTKKSGTGTKESPLSFTAKCNFTKGKVSVNPAWGDAAFEISQLLTGDKAGTASPEKGTLFEKTSVFPDKTLFGADAYGNEKAIKAYKEKKITAKELQEELKKYQNDKDQTEKVPNVINKFKGGYEIVGEIGIKDLYFVQECKYKTIKVFGIDTKIPCELEKVTIEANYCAAVSLSIKGKIENELTVCSIPIALPYGGKLDVDIILYAELNGELALKAEVNTNTKTELQKGKQKKTTEQTSSASADIAASFEAGPGLKAELSFLNVPVVDVEITVALLIEGNGSFELSTEWTETEEAIVIDRKTAFNYGVEGYVPIIKLKIGSDEETLANKLKLTFTWTIWNKEKAYNFSILPEQEIVLWEDHTELLKTNEEEKEASKEEAAPSGNIDLLSYYVHMTVGEEKDIIFSYPEGYTASDFTWSIKKPEIVSVKNGVIKAKKIGSTLVDIKSKDGKYYAACAIYVGEKQ